MTARSPSLDVGGEPWVGVFPGLGEVRVYADGAVEVTPEPGGADREPEHLRAAALRWGWGDLLGAHRRGLDLLHGLTAVSPPDECGVLLCGWGGLASRWISPLRVAGWRFLSDRPAPAVVGESGVTLHPRDAPFLTASRDVPDAPLARRDTDAAVLGLPRHRAPVPLRRIVVVDRSRVNHRPVEAVHGAERLQVALGLVVGGVLTDAEQTPAARFAVAQALAAVPMLRLRSESRAPDPGLVDNLLAWVAEPVDAR